jgi:hypothetical protein
MEGRARKMGAVADRRNFARPTIFVPHSEHAGAGSGPGVRFFGAGVTGPTPATSRDGRHHRPGRGGRPAALGPSFRSIREEVLS